MNPSNEDIGRMQQEAVRRVRDMQQRAKKMTTQNQPQQESRPKAKEEINAESETQRFAGDSDCETGGALAGLFKDKEKSLIILLLVLLGGEEENSELMLALLYLLI